MTIEPFITLRSQGVCLLRDDIDTDQIIPARFLTATGRAGLGRHLFADWRLDSAGLENAEFPLNVPGAAAARVLVAGRNFGCGSSREHAAWSLMDWGFRTVIASSFGDIFCNNAHKNGLLTIALNGAPLAALVRAIAKKPTVNIEVDLPRERVRAGTTFDARFTVDPFVKYCLTKGMDQFDFIRSCGEDIARWESAAPQFPSTHGGLLAGLRRVRA